MNRYAVTLANDESWMVVDFIGPHPFVSPCRDRFAVVHLDDNLAADVHASITICVNALDSICDPQRRLFEVEKYAFHQPVSRYEGRKCTQVHQNASCASWPGVADMMLNLETEAEAVRPESGNWGSLCRAALSRRS